MNEAVQLAQDVVRDMTGGFRFPIQINRDIGVAKTNFLDKRAQIQYRLVDLGPGCELLIVDRKDESRRARLLLRELRKIAVGRDPDDFDALVFDCLGKRTDAESARVFRAEVLIDDDDREMEFHAALLTVAGRRRLCGRRPVNGNTSTAIVEEIDRHCQTEHERTAGTAPLPPLRGFKCSESRSSGRPPNGLAASQLF